MLAVQTGRLSKPCKQPATATLPHDMLASLHAENTGKHREFCADSTGLNLRCGQKNPDPR
jgi:hypothetical protein